MEISEWQRCKIFKGDRGAVVGSLSRKKVPSTATEAFFNSEAVLRHKCGCAFHALAFLSFGAAGISRSSADGECPDRPEQNQPGHPIANACSNSCGSTHSVFLNSEVCPTPDETCKWSWSKQDFPSSATPTVPDPEAVMVAMWLP